jgi:GntR family transcriptional regulator
VARRLAREKGGPAMTGVRRDSPIPLYHQLKERLDERLANAEWKPGEMLPTEEMLQKEYNVSRTTVRLSLRELELEGKIVRYRGRGTFVAQPKISHSPHPHFSLTDFLRQQGVEPGWHLLSAAWVPAPTEVAERLQLGPETKVFQVRRLRMAGDEPIGYHVAHSRAEIARAVDVAHLEQGGSLDYLRQTGLTAGSYAHRTIEAVLASSELADLLNVQRGSALLQISRIVFDRDGTPIEAMVAPYRGDRLQYQIRQEPESKQFQRGVRVVHLE